MDAAGPAVAVLSRSLLCLPITIWKDPNSSFAQFTPKKMPKVVKGPVAGPQKISDGAAVCPLEHCIGETRGLDAHPLPQERPRLGARRAKHPRQRAGAGGQKSSARGRQPRTFGSRVKDGTGRAPPRVVERRGRPAEELAAGDEEPEKRRLDANSHQEEQERPRLEARRAIHPNIWSQRAPRRLWLTGSRRRGGMHRGKIVAARRLGNAWEYLFRWEGYGERDDWLKRDLVSRGALQEFRATSRSTKRSTKRAVGRACAATALGASSDSAGAASASNPGQSRVGTWARVRARMSLRVGD